MSTSFPEVVQRHQAWRPVEIEEPTNRWFIHPLSWVLARWFARHRVHPNAVSLMGLCCGVGAAVAYGWWHLGWTCWVGLVLMLLWHVLDGADGQLARLTGTASEWGKVMDGLCDHGTFVALYTALAWSLLPDMGGSAFLLAAGAGLSHFVQATAYERQRQLYEYIVLGKPTLIAAPERVSSGLLQRLYRLYLSVQQAFSGERQLVRVLATAEPEIAAAGREQYRRLFRPVVHGWSLLSSNYRTVALFVACSAGAPVAFLWWELVGLNVAMVLLRGWTYRRHQRWLALMQDQATLERH